MNIKIKNMSGKGFVLINWDRVDFVRETQSVYGDEYREIHIGKKVLATKDTLEEIQEKTSTFSEGWYNKQTKGAYDELGA
jgi:hypothetical protein